MVVISKVNLRILEMAIFWGGRVSDILPHDETLTYEAGLPTSKPSKMRAAHCSTSYARTIENLGHQEKTEIHPGKLT
jgi:hypothetical protein